jgi:hypothetical protein
VLAYERPSRFTYRLLSGLPVRDHVGEVTLSPEAGGTRISYRIETSPTVPLAGAGLVAAMRLAIGRLLAGVAAEAERRA